MDKLNVTVTVELKETATDPSIHTAEVIVQSDTGMYRETFGSASDLAAHLRGLKSMAATLGRQDIAVSIPEVPRLMLSHL